MHHGRQVCWCCTCHGGGQEQGRHMGRRTASTNLTSAPPLGPEPCQTTMHAQNQHNRVDLMYSDRQYQTPTHSHSNSDTGGKTTPAVSGPSHSSLTSTGIPPLTLQSMPHFAIKKCDAAADNGCSRTAPSPFVQIRSDQIRPGSCSTSPAGSSTQAPASMCSAQSAEPQQSAPST